MFESVLFVFCLFKMYCLTNLCYVCLKMKENLKNINNSYSNNEKLLRIIDCFAFNLSWLRHKSIILICEECCIKLEESYQFMEMCHENSTILQSYICLLDYSAISDSNNEAQLKVMLEDINKVKYNVQSEAKDEHDNFVRIIKEEPDTLVCDIKEEIPCANEIVNEEGGDTMIEYCDIKKEITSETEVNTIEDEYEMNNSNIEEKLDSEKLPRDHSNSTNINDGDNSKFTYDEVHASGKKNVITTKEKIFQCSLCGKCFACESYVQRHMTIHSGKKPHQCLTCKKCFVRKANLRRHIRTHSETKPYQCVTCQASFTSKPNLNRHRIKYCGKERHKCEICNMCFIRIEELNSHTLMHTGEECYTCSICGIWYTSQRSINSHMQTHVESSHT